MQTGPGVNASQVSVVHLCVGVCVCVCVCVCVFPQVCVCEAFMVTDSIHLSRPFTVKRPLPVEKLLGQLLFITASLHHSFSSSQLLFITNHSCC